MVFDLEKILFEMPFKIANTEFGPLEFHNAKIPIAFDAIIGMEFLRSKMVFIDFRKRKLYFYESKAINQDEASQQIVHSEIITHPCSVSDPVHPDLAC